MSGRVDTAITVEPQPGGRLLIVIERRRRLSFNLTADEAAILAEQLRRHLPEVAITRVGAAR